jgi:hypothetical protein
MVLNRWQPFKTHEASPIVSAFGQGLESSTLQWECLKARLAGKAI